MSLVLLDIGLNVSGSGGCAHLRIDDGEIVWFEDGSRYVACPDCGIGGFPLVDVLYETWTMVHLSSPPRGTARQRRLTMQRRMQAARRNQGQRRREYLAHLAGGAR